MIRFYSLIVPIFLITTGINLAVAQGKFTLYEGGAFSLKGGRLLIKEHIENKGCLVHTGGTIVFAGEKQSVYGEKPISFHRLEIKESSETTIRSAHHGIRHSLKVDGLLYPRKNLTLLADSTGFASIDGSGTGEIPDTLVIQKYIPSAKGYHFLGPPSFTNQLFTIADWIDLESSFPQIFAFQEESETNGWIAITDSLYLLATMRGYAMHLGFEDTTRTLSIAGVPNNGVQSVVLYNHAKPFTSGFELISNPYVSYIDWDAPIGWTKTNVDDAIYFFRADSLDAYGGYYSSYINQVSSDNSTDNWIAPLEAFFVHVTDGNPPVVGELSLSNEVRHNDTSNLSNSAAVPRDSRQGLVRLVAGNQRISSVDMAVIYFEEGASPDFEPSKDALKIMNTAAGAMNLYSRTTDGKNTSIKAYPAVYEGLKVPFTLSSAENALPYLHIQQATWAGVDTFFLYYHFPEQQYWQIAAHQNPYFITGLAAGTLLDFELVFSKKPPTIFLAEQEQSSVFLEASYTDDRILFKLYRKAGERVHLSLSNSMGTVLKSGWFAGVSSGEWEVSFPAGMYFLTARAGQAINTVKLAIGKW